MRYGHSLRDPKISPSLYRQGAASVIETNNLPNRSGCKFEIYILLNTYPTFTVPLYMCEMQVRMVIYYILYYILCSILPLVYPKCLTRQRVLIYTTVSINPVVLTRMIHMQPLAANYNLDSAEVSIPKWLKYYVFMYAWITHLFVLSCILCIYRFHFVSITMTAYSWICILTWIFCCVVLCSNNLSYISLDCIEFNKVFRQQNVKKPIPCLMLTWRLVALSWYWVIWIKNLSAAR